MILDVALHFALDMAGAATFACILKGCQDPAHEHRRLTRWLVRNPWKAQSIAALLVAIATVKVIG